MSKLAKKDWHLTDVVVSIIAMIFMTLLAGKIISVLKIVNPYFSYQAADTIGILCAIGILFKNYPLTLAPKIHSKQILKYILPAILAGFLFTSFPYYIWLSYLKLENIPKEYNLYINFNVSERLLFLFNLCLIGPIVEETFFRGFLYRIIKNRFNIFWGTIASTSIFYLAHGISAPFTIVIASLIYTYAYEKVKNIWGGIITHSANNALWFIFVYWGVKSHL